MKAAIISFLLILIPFQALLSQTDSLEFLPDETGFPFDTDERTDFSDFPEIIEELKENPVDINKAELIDLLNIPLIDLKTAESILKYREEYGRIFSSSELYSINGIDNKAISRVIPFFTFGDKTKPKIKDDTQVSHEILFKKELLGFSFRSRFVSNSAAIKPDNYPGSPQKIYNRFIYSGDNLKAGLLIEKDAGESKLNDFTSFYFSLRKYGIVDQFIVGDYILEFGEGLALSDQFRTGKNSDLYSIGKMGRGLVPYTGSEENRFFRGSAVMLNLDPIKLSVFYSANKFDAVTQDSSGCISSIPWTGYHRTESELRNEDAGSETCTGGSVSIKVDSLIDVSLLAYNSLFKPPLTLSEMNYAKIGQYTMYSLAYKAWLNNIYITGEIAHSMDKTSFISFFQKQLSDRLDIFLTLRSYAKEFPYIHSNAFGENSGRAENETGFFIGGRFYLSFGRFSFYHDRFSSAQGKTPARTGNETSISYQNTFEEDLDIKCRFRNKSVQGILSPDSSPETISNYLSLEARYPALNEIRFSTRFSFSHLSYSEFHSNETGFGLSQDMQYQYELLRVNGRATYFRTTSYYSRIYEYEYDLPGVLNRSILYGEGIKWYLMINYEVMDNISVALKYSQLFATREGSLISEQGPELNVENNIFGLQLDIKL